MEQAGDLKLTRAKLEEDAERMEADTIPKTIPEDSTTDAPSLIVEDLRNNLATPLTVKGLMAPPEGIFPHGGRFPSSRDWSMPEVKCSRGTCVANYSGKCTMPSLIEIGPKGCKGFQKRASGLIKKLGGGKKKK